MIWSSLLLYLVLLTGGTASAPYEFKWDLCEKETACFVGFPSSTALSPTKAKPPDASGTPDVTLSIRAYDASMKTLLVRVLLLGPGLDYAKGVSLSVSGLPKFTCALKDGKVTLNTEGDKEDELTFTSSTQCLYCEFIMRRAEAILPATLPPGPAQSAKVTYWDGATEKNVDMAYAAFRSAIDSAVTCDPSLIKFDSYLRSINETTRKVSALLHKVDCGEDPLWELRFETPPDSGKDEVAKSILCEETSTVWGWKVTKKDGTAKAKVGEWRAHCATSICLLCTAPTACASPSCVNPKFTQGEKKADGKVKCATLTCPKGTVFSAADMTARYAACREVSPHLYRWTIDGAPAESVECVKESMIGDGAKGAQGASPLSAPVNLAVVGVCAAILVLVIIGMAIYCIISHRKNKKTRSSSKKVQSTARLQEMHTGKTPDSDQENAVFATGKLTVASKTTGSFENLEVKEDEKGGAAKKDATGKTGKAKTPKPKSTRLKKKSNSSSKKGRSSKKSGKSKTDPSGDTDDDKKSKEPTENNETDKQSNERIPNGPIKKFEPDNNPYESLINVNEKELAAAAGIVLPKNDQKKALKSPKAGASKRNKTQTKTEQSARDKTVTRPNDEEGKPSLEPMRDPMLMTSKEDLSNKENDDKTQSGTERNPKKK